jgi:uncharacterized protein YndB with AHSA1/START domain
MRKSMLRRLLRRFASLVAAMAALAIGPAFAEVKSVSAAAFALETNRVAQATPAKVFYSLTRDIGRWWDSAHTYSGDAANLSIETRAGGCFCEQLSGGGSVQHGEVIYAQPNSILRLRAELGPLQEMPVVGVLTFQLEPAERGTTVRLSYRVSGELPPDTAALAKVVDSVLTTQLERLVRFADGGNAP